MTCITYQQRCSQRPAFLCVQPFHRLRLDDGGYVFMDWHSYCGPTFYRDRAARRVIWNWWMCPAIVRALDWFLARGCRG